LLLACFVVCSYYIRRCFCFCSLLLPLSCICTSNTRQPMALECCLLRGRYSGRAGGVGLGHWALPLPHPATHDTRHTTHEPTQHPTTTTHRSQGIPHEPQATRGESPSALARSLTKVYAGRSSRQSQPSSQQQAHSNSNRTQHSNSTVRRFCTALGSNKAKRKAAKAPQVPRGRIGTRAQRCLHRGRRQETKRHAQGTATQAGGTE